MSGGWLMEVYDSELHGYAVKQRIFSGQTPYQSVEIVETVDFGRALVIDGIPQSSELDEFIYHEIMAHPALCAIPDPKSALIIGGGEGATLREVCRHQTLESITMVDIDPDLISITREHLPTWHQGAFDDPRLTMVYGDGRTFIEETDQHYDCIILDLVDPYEDSPANKLFTVEFYAMVRERLSPRGVMSLQALSAGMHHDQEHLELIATLKAAFPQVFPCYAFIPIYSTFYGFAVCGGDDLTLDMLTAPQIDTTLHSRGITDLRFYSSAVAQSIFTIPRYMQDRLTDPTLAPWTDSTH